jgi:hypothetical protein
VVTSPSSRARTAGLTRVCWTTATPIGGDDSLDPAVRRRLEPGLRRGPFDEQDRAKEHFPLLVLELAAAQLLLDGAQATEGARVAAKYIES